MKRIIPLALLTLTACFPDVDKAADEAVDDAVEQCEKLLEGHLDGFKEWLEAAAQKRVDDILTDLGCVEYADGWDCSPVCDGPPAIDAGPAPDADCSMCDDGTPDPPDGGSACPPECEGPF